MCEARQIIEVGLSRLAARYADDDDIGRLEDALARMAQAWKDNDDATWAAADLDYHLAIARAADNDLLAQFYDISRELLAQTAEYLAAMPHAKQRGYELQVYVVDAVRAHDPDAAGKSANQLMRYLMELIRAPQ